MTNLGRLLSSYFGGHPATLEPGELDSPTPANSSGHNKSLGSLMTSWKHLFGRRQKDARLPWTRPSRDDMELRVCSKVTEDGRVDHKFVLMCLPFLRWAKKLHQVDMCNLQSDQVFFLSLRKQYSLVRKSRPWKSLARFRRVNSLEFAKVSDSVRVLHQILMLHSSSAHVLDQFMPLDHIFFSPVNLWKWIEEIN